MINLGVKKTKISSNIKVTLKLEFLNLHNLLQSKVLPNLTDRKLYKIEIDRVIFLVNLLSDLTLKELNSVTEIVINLKNSSQTTVTQKFLSEIVKEIIEKRLILNTKQDSTPAMMDSTLDLFDMIEEENFVNSFNASTPQKDAFFSEELSSVFDEQHTTQPKLFPELDDNENDAGVAQDDELSMMIEGLDDTSLESVLNEISSSDEDNETSDTLTELVNTATFQNVVSNESALYDGRVEEDNLLFLENSSSQSSPKISEEEQVEFKRLLDSFLSNDFNSFTDLVNPLGSADNVMGNIADSVSECTSTSTIDADFFAESPLCDVSNKRKCLDNTQNTVNKKQKVQCDKANLRRLKNNEASKITRSRRKTKHQTLFQQEVYLEKSNAQLKIKIDKMQQQANYLRSILVSKLSASK